jgi:DNA mismatch repair protein MutS2
LKPTYRLLIGVPGKSNAFEISKRLGLPEYIIEDAKKSISSESLKFEDLIQSLQEKSIKASEDARKSEMLKLEAINLKDKYEEKLYSLEETRGKLIIDAQKEGKRLIKETKEEADNILKNIRDLERMGYSSDVRQKLEEERKKLTNKLDKLEEETDKSEKDKGEKIEEVKLGEEVYLPKLNKNVIILSKPDNKGEVQVQAGIMKISVKLEDLRVANKSKEVNKKINKREAKLNIRMVDPSLDLRGMDAEEAIYSTDKYLDEAYMAGLKVVTIIHGKGTGILRKAINDMLKSHSHVKSHRLGEYGEGGSGVTIAELK